MTPFRKILIANRGEIAIRIARAASELGISTVGIFSYEDRYALHRYKTDESYKVGQKGDPLKGYLAIDEILDLAVRTGSQAVHPGYGFLSENENFAKEAEKRGIVFIGPSVQHLKMFGDKVLARHMAQEACLPLIPGSQKSLDSFEEAQSFARTLGYPVTLKAKSGGGGKGIRMLKTEDELKEAFERAKSEAKLSFGQDDLYLEKTIVSPRHVEVQILGDQQGSIVHLFTRDCSIQRRHQKVVEVAPALNLPQKTIDTLHESALKLARHVGYYGLGTMEFLVDQHGQAYFLEVNPRVQVEHTVTEMITGVDLIQASILVASGASLDHPLIGITSQASIEPRGCSIQCRITTEDPLGGFAPDMGKIIAYRPAAGFGIRLDEGHGTAGGLVTPYYDSLLVKVTSWGKTLDQAATKVHRSLKEFRIRGVKHNIHLLKKIVSHKKFLSYDVNTDFLTQYPELFQYEKPKDRATKLLTYLAQVSVNDLHKVKTKDWPMVDLPLPPNHYRCAPKEDHINAKKAFDQDGTKGLIQWIKHHKKLLLTDTTMRDAHQSLFATRLRTKDMLAAAPYYAGCGEDFFSLEVWGGATFDTALRFLKEDPWQRLESMRKAVPNVLLQMLIRGDNAVGYTNYPKWVIWEFIKEAKASGIDIFRIFDCLNQIDKMIVAIDGVKTHGGIAEVCLCYTGDLSKESSKYNLSYYLKEAQNIVKAGADILCIKDMAGLLKPKAASILIKALKEHVDIPIHLHTHDTPGTQIATLLAAANAGCEIVDGALASMSGLTSQPSLNALVACLEGEALCPDVPLRALDELSRYWEVVRSLYEAFDPGIKSTTTEVYHHEIPGGQYSNLYQQAVSIGLSEAQFHSLTTRYAEVNTLLGDIIKVTPSSKVVGDFALLLEKHKITGPDLLKKKPHLDYPDSVISFFKGHMGVPYGGFPQEIRSLVLGDNPPEPMREPLAKEDRFEQVQEELAQKLERSVSRQEVLSYRLYPKVFLEYVTFCRKYSDVLTQLPTKVFFYGLRHGQEMEVDLEPGKTLFVVLKGISSPDDKGQKNVFFNLNGFDREITILDESLQGHQIERAKADPLNSSHVGSPMPGKVMMVKKKPGDMILKGEPLVIIEAMKMEYGVSAKESGVIADILVHPSDMVEQGDLLISMAPKVLV